MTGPFKINGVPIRRVNARYVIATSTKVDVGSLDKKTLDKISGPEYFSREKKSRKQKGEDTFMKQGDNSEVGEVSFDGCFKRLIYRSLEESTCVPTCVGSEEHR